MEDYNKRLENALIELKKTEISAENKQLIQGFINQLSAEDISIVRQLKYLYTLKPLAKILNKNFSKTNKNDITQLISEINKSNYKYWTKRDFKVVIKRFYKWLREQEGKKFEKWEYPEEVKWIST